MSHGCASGLQPHLGSMVGMLLPALGDVRPMVRIIACWTLGRYSHWMLQGGRQRGGEGGIRTESGCMRAGRGRGASRGLAERERNGKGWSSVVSSYQAGAMKAGRKMEEDAMEDGR